MNDFRILENQEILNFFLAFIVVLFIKNLFEPLGRIKYQ